MADLINVGASLTTRQQVDVRSRHVEPSNIVVYSGGSQESTQIALEQMVRWFSVWPKTVAEVWTDPQGPFSSHLAGDANAALHNAFGFQVPGGVTLNVKLQKGAFDPNTPYTPIDLQMILPPLPTVPTDGPVALAAYAESGRSFPFTLCTVTC